jgi:hypothetical protein
MSDLYLEKGKLLDKLVIGGLSFIEALWFTMGEDNWYLGRSHYSWCSNPIGCLGNFLLLHSEYQHGNQSM